MACSSYTPSRDPSKPVNHLLGAVPVYGAGFVLGLAMVSFPASATVLKSQAGFSDSQYGLIFIPQLIMAIIGSLGSGILANRVGLKSLLITCVLLTGICQVCLLSALLWFEPSNALYIVMLATGLFGLAFGISAAPLNTYPSLLFTSKADSALVAMHTLVGVGLSLGPFLLGRLIPAGLWVYYPISISAITSALCLIGLIQTLPREQNKPRSGEPALPSQGGSPLKSRVLWSFVAVAVFYAFVEGTFANWTVIFLSEERNLDFGLASLALSVFWAMLATGRLLISALLLKMRSETIWLILPFFMIVLFLLLPLTNSAAMGIGLFAAAGLACSGFFPLTVGLLGKRFPDNRPLTSSLLVAALMSGVGIGSFVIGFLRTVLSFNWLYPISAAYPILALIIAFIGTGISWKMKPNHKRQCN